MTKKKTLAQKLLFTAGDPSSSTIANREDTWASDRMFFCAAEKLPSNEKIRQGKDSEDVLLRLWFRPREVSLTIADRILLAGATYSIYFVAERDNESWCACQRVNS